MNDERLLGMLGSLRYERLDRVSDDRIRRRLEEEWALREHRRSPLLRLAPIVATLVLLAGIGFAALRAPGDSVLYGVRVRVEDAAALLYSDPQERAQYLLSLLDERQAEAARLEASGNALAAARVRAAEDATLQTIRGLLPEAPEVVPDVSPSPSPTDTPTPSPSPTPTATASPTPTPRPTLTRTPTPRPATPAPTVAATPLATGTPMPVALSGRVKNPDLTLASGVCVRLDPTSPVCLAVTDTSGTYTVAATARLYQTVTLYFTRQDPTALLKAYVSTTVKGAVVQMPDAKLAP